MSRKDLAKKLHDMNIRQWTSRQTGFFYLIVTKACAGKRTTLYFNKEELMEAAGSGKDGQLDAAKIRQLMKNFGSLCIVKETGDGFFEVEQLFDLFQFRIHPDGSGEAAIHIAASFLDLARFMKEHFSMKEFIEYAGLRSVYSQSLYELLKDQRQSGISRFGYEDFCLKMDIPKAYHSNHIKQKILNPAIEELQSLFASLTVQTLKAKSRGTPVTGYQFTWNPVCRPTAPAKKEKAGSGPVMDDISRTVLEICARDYAGLEKKDLIGKLQSLTQSIQSSAGEPC